MSNYILHFYGRSLIIYEVVLKWRLRLPVSTLSVDLQWFIRKGYLSAAVM